jgi:hypothetical protein
MLKDDMLVYAEIEIFSQMSMIRYQHWFVHKPSVCYNVDHHISSSILLHVNSRNVTSVVRRFRSTDVKRFHFT